MPRPKSYPADLRDRLIHAAAESMSLGDPDELSLRTLAASQGTSTNAIYTLFGGKDQLMAAVAQEARASFAAAQKAALTDVPPREVLNALGCAYRQWALEHPALYRVMFQARRTTPTRPDVAGLAPLSQIVEMLMGAGALPDGDVAETTASLWAAVHGWVTLESAGLLDADDEAFLRHLERYHAGLGLRPAA